MSLCASVEVMVLWDQTILQVWHLTPPRSFYVGEGDERNGRCDYVVPSERLGAKRAPVILASASEVAVVVLPGAKGTIEVNGRAASLEEAIAGGRARPCVELPGAHQVALPAGSTARIILDDGLTFQVSTGDAERVVARRGPPEVAPAACIAISALIHGGLVAAMLFITPALAVEDGSMSADQQHLFQRLLNAAAERALEDRLEQERRGLEESEEESIPNCGSRGGKCDESDRNPSGSRQRRRWGFEFSDPTEREALLRDAEDLGLFVRPRTAAHDAASTGSWGPRDPERENPWELEARSRDWFGLDLAGIGEGGGGRGEGISLLSVDRGLLIAGSAAMWGFGSGSSLHHRRLPKPPHVRMGATEVSGRIPPEIVHRIVRENFSRFRVCYTYGLRNNPSLQGTIVVSFTIGRTGAISSVGGGGSMPDGGVVRCVVNAFRGLSFPETGGSYVKVTYPLLFQPGR